ncbi:TetR/AcrR family transcriptional regulator [Cohnella lubricantis]|uniref:TetR/AcrR family transcriptional regulator n=1 Tax=Cohnella lubricantis TaxID=2163172 RepID=A0A841TEF6_9BACL|nr:TetR/AcrR family transcriptional regulator [Cohnella lubricantis]MBB6678636.1 TetR/AcrR family transcriptional regulator [Cohnella lubricantis]MBP2119204.1 AcrR family transcriptional regulator [Cohnella lubricantis]
MPTRRERSDAADNRRLILQTAKSLFEEHGVEDVSMHQIAKTAGIGQGTLYRRYAHKGDLCCDLIEDAGAEAISAAERYASSTSDTLSPSERLGGALDLLVDFIDDKLQLLIPLHSVHMSAEDKTAFFRSPIYINLKRILTQLLQEVPSNSGEVDPQIKAHVILCSLNPAGYLHMRDTLGFSKEEIKQYYRKLYAGI